MARIVKLLSEGETNQKGREGENQNNDVSFWTTGSKRVIRVLIMMF